MRRILIVLGIIVGYLIVPLNSNAKVIEVCTDCQYNTITEAVLGALPHDTILVNSGTYLENTIEINKPLVANIFSAKSSEPF